MQVLRAATTGAHPEGWVVGDTALDDAAALRVVHPSVDGGPLLVQTVDFITPVVDDPHVFGQIAAANALSDVYAMGGEPRFCLNIVGFPSDRLPLSVLEGILRGGASKVREAGAIIVGGHTVKDAEPKYGLSVTGIVEEDVLVTQAGAKVGDALVLSKPLGTGLVIGGARGGAVDEATVAAAVQSMCTLNRVTTAAMREVGVNAATDVTGFGLLGHALHIAERSGVAIAFDAELPALPGARERAAKASLGGAAGRNLAYVQDALTNQPAHEALRLAVDPQTSGGLLIAVAPDRIDALLSRLDGAARIGTVDAGPAGSLRLG